MTLDDVAWADLPDREEAGSPNVVGAVALAAALSTLAEIGRGRIAAHEADLLSYATDRLRRVPGLHLYGPTEPAGLRSRLGVIPFNISGVHHGLVAAVLGYEHGVGARHGCFCAHPYLAHLLGLDEAAFAAWAQRARRGDMRDAPGMVRISFGCYNDEADVDRAAIALEHLAAGEVAGSYRCDDDGEHHPIAYREPMPVLFTMKGGAEPMSRMLAMSVGSRSFGSPRPVEAQRRRETLAPVATYRACVITANLAASAHGA